MGDKTRSKILPWLAATITVALLALLLVVLPREEGSASTAPAQGAKTAAPAQHPAPADFPPRTPSANVTPDPSANITPDPIPGSPSPDEPRRHPVDLAKLRERLPGNIYWELGAPTSDPEVLKKRAEDGRHWNELYGKVLSNTATEEEIHQYYDHRRKVSEDYIAFASLVLQEYGSQLPDQERGLYELSIRMHRTRLDEMPQQLDEALARKRIQDQRRKEWLGNGRGR